ncbi:MAG: hypothetical protein JW719_10700 [Pirellulales bacterium]|nr:hypothetical protein [Pirellulales bacterium]
MEGSLFLEGISRKCSVFVAMSMLAVGMFHREMRGMATQAWPWHLLQLSETHQLLVVAVNSGRGIFQAPRHNKLIDFKNKRNTDSR